MSKSQQLRGLPPPSPPPTPPPRRQVSYEAAEVAEDSGVVLVAQPGPHNGRSGCGGGRGGSNGGGSGGGGSFGVIGVTLCAFALGCLLSFAVTLLVTRNQVGDCSQPRSGDEGNWPDETQLRANRARLRALASSPGELEDHVAALSGRQSRAGTDGSRFHADYVANAWRQLGLPVINRTYSVLLSYLDTTAVPEDRIGVFLCSSASDSACPERLRLDPPLTSEDGAVGALHSIVPYTRPLDGRYKLMTQEQVFELSGSSVDDLRSRLSNTVVLIDSNLDVGGGSPASVAYDFPNATLLGMAAGVLKKSAPEPRPGVPAYPEGTGVPDSLIWVRSTLNTDIKGDPMTPMYPSKPYAVRYGFDPEPPSQPTIPVSAADALRLRQFAADSPAGEAHVRIGWPMRTGLRPALDTCTELLGAAEPDRVVLLGGHRDAWHSGALDPHSGLSSLLVITRALADLHRRGWRPRRTLLVCTWDAEEWNLMGSAEWLDEELRRADRRLVAYVNTDTDVMGNWKMMVHAFQRWQGFLDELIAEVPNPDPTGDRRYHFYKTEDAYSDYYIFWRNLGIPFVDLSYIRPNKTRMVVYDLYHSRYDTVRLYRMTDPGGRAHLAAVHNYLGMVYTLLDSPLLPLNLTAYGEEIEARMRQLYGQARVAGWARKQRGSGGGRAEPQSLWADLDVAFNRELQRAVRALRGFEAGPLARLRAAGAAVSWAQLRMANDKLMEVQRAFVYRSVYPSQELVNLLADETSIRQLLSSAFGDSLAEPTHQIVHAGRALRNLRVQKLIETCILSLASVPKILSDSFAD